MNSMIWRVSWLIMMKTTEEIAIQLPLTQRASFLVATQLSLQCEFVISGNLMLTLEDCMVLVIASELLYTRWHNQG